MAKLVIFTELFINEHMFGSFDVENFQLSVIVIYKGTFFFTSIVNIGHQMLDIQATSKRKFICIQINNHITYTERRKKKYQNQNFMK